MANGERFNKIIKLEEVCKKTFYTLTVNPNDSRQFFDKDNRMTKFLSYFKMYIVPMFIGDVNGFIEISPTGRLHFHGTLKFRNNDQIYRFYLDNVHKLTTMCMLEIDTIDDIKVWNKYISKQQQIITSITIISSDDSIRSLDDIYSKFKLEEQSSDSLSSRLGSE